jgi:drug/metabolite transporter (DMT)-like permease
MSYARFGWMILTSTLVMFGLMYLNTYAASHLWFSETRAYMALVMGASMAVVMLVFMLKHYPKTRVNLAILAGAVVAFAGSLWLVRSQSTVEDISWMKAMIPHHSIAILTSERASLRDPRVRQLADEIIATQRREIDQMESLIRDLEEDNGGR